MVEMVEYAQGAIKEAAQTGAKIAITGGHRQASDGEIVLSMKDYTGVVRYQPAELYITVKAGTPFDTVQDIVKENNQIIPFAPDTARTIGGAYALGSSANQYRLRDYVLGVSIIDGRGKSMRFGGEVLKNVAGFDVSRLLIGSAGKMALITDVSLRVIPLNLMGSTVENKQIKRNIDTLNSELNQRLKMVFDPMGVFV